MTVQSEIDQALGTIGGFLGSIVGSPGVQDGIRLALWAMIILWFVTVLWAFRDARARSRSWLVALGAPTGIALATPAAFPLAVFVWRILRPARTVAEAREEQLTIDALLASSHRPTCLGCGSKVNAEWRRCPWCRTWLQASCPRCQRLVELSAAVCPWCVLDLAPGALVAQAAAPSMVPVMAGSAAMTPAMDPPLRETIGATMPIQLPRRHDGPLTPPAPTPAHAAQPAALPERAAAAAKRAAAATRATPTRPGRSRRPRVRANSPDLHGQPEEPAQSSTALW